MSGEVGGDVALVAKAVKRNRLGKFTETRAQENKTDARPCKSHQLPSHL